MNSKLVILPKTKTEVEKIIQFLKKEEIEYWQIVDKEAAPTLKELETMGEEWDLDV